MHSEVEPARPVQGEVSILHEEWDAMLRQLHSGKVTISTKSAFGKHDGRCSRCAQGFPSLLRIVRGDTLLRYRQNGIRSDITSVQHRTSRP
jgi:hypothetical protein